MGHRALSEVQNICKVIRVHERAVEEVEFWMKVILRRGEEELSHHDAGFTQAPIGCCLGRHLCNCYQWILLAVCTGRAIDITPHRWSDNLNQMGAWLGYYSVASWW